MHNTICVLWLLVCELQFQFHMFDVHRKLLTAWKINTALWREETPQTPQQDDTKSCGVYVLKVGLHWPAISTEITVKFRFRIRKSLKVVNSRKCNPGEGTPYQDYLYYTYARNTKGVLFARLVVYKTEGIT